MINKYAPLLLSVYYGFRICCLLLFTGLSLICFAGWEVPVFILILFCLLFSLIATISDDRYFTNIPYKIRRFLYPIILLLIICVLLLRQYEGQSFFQYLSTVFAWLVQNLNQKADYSMEYSLFVLFLLYLVLSLIIKFCERYFKMQLCLSLAIVVCIFLLGATQIKMSPLALFGGFFYIADTCMTFCLRILTKNKEVSSYCASLSSIIILMIGLVVLLPYSKDPIPYYKVANAVDRMVYEVSGIGQDILVNFANNFVGIGDGKISLTEGNVKEDDAIVIRVYKCASNYNPIYLISSISDYYTGNSWGNEIETTDDINEYELNTEERFKNLSAAGFDKTDPIFHNISMKIQYRYIYTRNILFPENCLTIVDFTPLNSIVTKGINIKFKRKPKLDSSYSISQAEINLKDEKLVEYLKNCVPFAESLQDDPARYEKFAPYLQLPEELPTRIADLAAEITADCYSDYEKAECIRQYVQQLPYSTSVSDLPDQTDAVDYFLFEQREGYCIHYASAVAILCRSIGIPSRYIQGVALGEGKKAYQWFDVGASASHAWCEAYINGYGWMRIDATPIEEITSYYNWPEIADVVPVEPTDNLPPMPYPTDQPVDTTEMDLETLRERQEQRRILTLYAVLAISILAIVVIILIIINIISKEHKKKLFLHSSFNDQASTCLQEILAHLSYLGVTKRVEETMKEFTDRLNQLEPDQYTEIIKVLNSYNNKRYSKNGFTEKDIVALQRAIMLLQSRFIDRYGKFQYFIKTNLKLSA